MNFWPPKKLFDTCICIPVIISDLTYVEMFIKDIQIFFSEIKFSYLLLNCNIEDTLLNMKKVFFIKILDHKDQILVDKINANG